MIWHVETYLEELPRGMTSCKELSDKAFEIASNPKCDEC